MIKDIEGLIAKVTGEIRNHMEIAVLGLSGGADSTLVAILCRRALGKDSVFGIHMPYNDLDKDTFNARSVKLVVKLGISDRIIDIGPSVDTMLKQFSKISTLNQGNMRSRMRMLALYSACCELGEQTDKQCRVVGTGNLSEDFIGFDTKGGDALADFFPIGSLVKSEVYQLLDYFKDQGVITEAMIDRVPSAGLWDGQTDEDELGYSYNEMEPHVLNMYNGGQVDLDNKISRFVCKRNVDNKHKHEAPPLVDLRQFCS